MNKILVVNVNWLGDVLFSTPLIRAIRNKYPSAHIACMVVPRCLDVLEGNPNLDRLIVYDEDGARKSLLGKLKFVSELRKERFDGAIILHRSLTRTLLLALAQVRRRMGYYTRKRSFLLTEKPMAPEGDLHRIDLFCELGERLGIEVTGQHGCTRQTSCTGRTPEFYIKDEDRRFARRLLLNGGIKPDDDRVVALNPGGNWLPKRWPAENFALLANDLVKKLKAKVVITGSAADEELAMTISRTAGAEVFGTCGRTNLKQLGAIMERANLVIANDSGPVHIAAAMGAKIIALFGPTSVKVTGPRGKGKLIVLQKDVGCKIPCYSMNCKDNRCMKAITPEDVCEAAGKMLDAG